MSINTSAPIPDLVFKNYDEMCELYQAVEYIPEELMKDAKEYGEPTLEQKALMDVIARLKTIHDNYIKTNYY